MTKIITDTTSNITPAEAATLGVELMPLSIIFGDKEYKDAFELSAEEFYDKLEASSTNPRSSQINIDAFENRFKKAKTDKDTLIVILISSALSGTYNSAVIAKENVGYKNIYIFDSLCTTVMQKILVLEALKNSSLPPKSIIEKLADLRGRLELYAMVDTLEYLYRGGRLKKGAAIAGKLFHVKPIVTITPSGHVEIFSKAIGSRLAYKGIKKATDADNIDYDYPVMYVFAKHREKSIALLNEIHPGNEDFIESCTNVCPVIGVHIGPGAAGICFVRKKKNK